MWILPKQLHTSPFVPDTEALISDSNEFSQLCAQSLTQRGKDSAARTWSAKLKRDSWMQHLYGRTLKPSHGPSFTAAWTSSVAATRASHSAQPASDSAPKTHGTSGRLSQPELLQCDQVPVSLKTSRDISRWGCPTLSKTWADWVTERRGAWRARVNAARLTRGSGSLSWPTISVNESKNSVGKSQEHRNSIPLGTMAAMQDAANWPTPAEQDGKQGGITPFQAKGGNHTNLLHIAAIKSTHGQADPASSSTSGSRQGLSEPSQRNWQTFAHGTHNRGETPHRQVVKALVNGDKAKTQCLTVDQVFAEEIKKQWATPAARDTQGKRGAAANARKGNPLDTLPNQMAQWGTPTARDHKSGRGNNEREYKELTPMVERQQTGKLNPRWVETLMGLPIGWTMPSCIRPVTIEQTSCGASGTALFQQPASERSDFLLAS